MNQLELKRLLNNIINNIGIKGKMICNKTGISPADLSRFKNGKIGLCLADSERLEKYLSTFKALI